MQRLGMLPHVMPPSWLESLVLVASMRFAICLRIKVIMSTTRAYALVAGIPSYGRLVSRYS